MSQTSVNVDDPDEKKQQRPYQMASMTQMPTNVSLRMPNTSHEIGNYGQTRLNEPVNLYRKKNEMTKKHQQEQDEKLRDMEQTSSVDEQSTRVHDHHYRHHERGLSSQDRLPYIPAYTSNIYQPIDYSMTPQMQIPVYFPQQMRPQQFMPPQQLMSQQQFMPMQQMVPQQQMMPQQLMMPQQQMVPQQMQYSALQPMTNQNQGFVQNSQVITTQPGGSVIRSASQPRTTIFEQKIYTIGNTIYKMPSFTKIY